MTLLLSSLSTPIGNLNLIAHEHVLLAANLSNLKALKESLSAEDAEHDFKSVAKIPVIILVSEAISLTSSIFLEKSTLFFLGSSTQ